MPMPSKAVILTGVGATFCASHHDLLSQQMHGHSYEVEAWFAFPEPRDARAPQEALKALLRVWDHTVLEPELASAEAIAAAILQLLPHCVDVRVSRPLERLYARAMT
jgi:6-pyruvoyl-tetrahydropterin synthase